MDELVRCSECQYRKQNNCGTDDEYVECDEWIPLLKQCPFCGSEAIMADNGRVIDPSGEMDYADIWWVECAECGAFMHSYSDTDAQAAEAWNRRVGDTPEPLKEG